MRTGEMTERLAFQRNTPTTSTQSGRGPASWATVATIWGAVAPVTGRETLATQAVTSLVTYRGTIAQQQLHATAVSVSSITRTGTTATVTTGTAHGYATGEYVRIAGATQTAYNGKVAVTVTGSTTFTFTVSGSPTTPATGTITATLLVPVTPQLRIVWTPSWDSAQAAKTLQIHAVRLLGREWFELDLGEAA